MTTTAIMRSVLDNYGARIFDHELTAENETFPEPLRGITAKR